MSTALASRELKTFHQIANALRIPLAVSVAGNRIAPSGRIDTNVRPKYSCRNLHGRHCRYRNALLCAAKQPRLDAQHVLRTDHNTSGKEKIPSRQTAGREALCVGCRISHVSTLSDFGRRLSTKGSLAKCQVQNAKCRFLHPFQSAFFPDPDVAHDQNGQEDQHLNQSEHA